MNSSRICAIGFWGRIKRIGRQTGYWLVLVVSIALVSCEREADEVEVPEVAPKLVIASFISPQDSVLSVHVSKSMPLYGTDLGASVQEVTNATVVLSDGTASITLPYAKSGQYAIHARLFRIQPGKTYSLTATVPGDFRATASCTVPMRANDGITDIRLDSMTIHPDPSYSYQQYRLAVDWQDAAGEGDYYRLYAQTYEVIQGFDPGNPSRTDTAYFPINFNQGQVYAKDEGQDGRKFSVKEGEFLSSSYGMATVLERKVKVFLLTTDRNYYKYHQDLENYEGDNPFAEPTLVHSNVEGGLGIFGAYQQVLRERDY